MLKLNQKHPFFATGTVSMLAIMIAVPAHAQGAETDVPSGEIVVTAQKREQSLKDVPISISVLSGEELDRSSASGVQEMISRAPGVTFDTNAQGNGTQVSIRGVGAAFSTTFGSSTVAYYLDSIPYGFVRSSALPDPDIYDLDRVEVLRGPQGTLYGASGVGGVVRVLTKDADLNNFRFKGRINASQTEHGGTNGRGDVAVSVPLIPGKLGARAVFGYEKLSGWVDAPLCSNCNDSETFSGRFKLNAQPTNDLTLAASVWISRTDRGSLGYSVDGLTDYGRADLENGSIDFDVYSLQVGYDFGSLALNSSTGYLRYAQTRFDGNITAATNPVTQQTPATTFSQEVNLVSTGDGPWRWTLGGMYRDGTDTRRERNNAGVAEANFLSESWAVFGELTYVFLDGNLELTGGLRYFKDRVGVDEISSPGLAPAALLPPQRSKFTATTPRAVLTWKPSRRFTAYASYAEGFRSGGPQQPAVLRVDPTLAPFKPDRLRNYEIGAKGILLNGLVSYDLAAYYIDWKDVQVPLVVVTPGGLRSLLVNGAAASGLGGEFNFAIRPAKGFQFGVNGNINDLKYSGDVISGTAVLFRKGERLNNSAKYTFGAWADASFPVGRTLTGRLSASANLVGSQRLALLGAINSRSGEQFVGRMSAALESSDGWTASLFVENIGNERDNSSPYVQPGSAPLFGAPRSFYPRPRTIGLQLEYKL